MRVKIVKANSTSWYHEYLNHEFEILFTLTDHYVLTDSPKTENHVLKEDCEIVIPSNRQKAIQLFASCDGVYADQIDMITTLLNDIDTANEKVKALNEILK